jgi:hypothetical protein
MAVSTLWDNQFLQKDKGSLFAGGTDAEAQQQKKGLLAMRRKNTMAEL